VYQWQLWHVKEMCEAEGEIKNDDYISTSSCAEEAMIAYIQDKNTSGSYIYIYIYIYIYYIVVIPQNQIHYYIYIYKRVNVSHSLIKSINANMCMCQLVLCIVFQLILSYYSCPLTCFFLFIFGFSSELYPSICSRVAIDHEINNSPKQPLLD